MVRLGAYLTETARRPELCFNSNMVRLGAKNIAPVVLTAKVSIPIWFDWESAVHAAENDPEKFQFQYGSIGRKI